MKIILLIILISSYSLAQNRWEKLNGPLGGVVISILAKGDTLVTSMGEKSKIYYSTNEGALWIETPEKFPDTVIDMVLADDGGIIAGVHYHGIFRSYDLINWENIYSYTTDDIWSVGKDQYGNLYGGTEKGRIIISTNNGSTWSVDFLGMHRINNFELNVYYNTVIAGEWKRIFRKEASNWTIINIDSITYVRIFSGAAGKLFAHDNSKLYISRDGGNTWIKQDTARFLITTDVYFMTYNSRIIAGCSSNEFQPGWGIALSDDDGQSWRYTHSGLPPKFIRAGPFLNVEQITYAGTRSAGIFKSTDFGENWTAVNTGLTAASTNQLCFDNKGTIYTANWSNGFQKSSDNGETWKVINNGLTNSISFSIVADDNGNLIGGTQEGIFRSTDEGENWVQTTPVENNFSYILIKDRFNRIYSVLYGRGIFRTTDLGYSWERIDNGFGSQGVFGLYIDNLDNIYAGTFGGRIYRTTDDGLNWTLLYNSPRPFATTCDIVVTDEGYIYASTNYEGIIRSTDDGVNWELIKEDTLYIPKNIFAAYQNGLYAAGSGNKIFYSSDKGENWTDFTDNLEYTTIWNKAFDNEGKLYFATDEGVWKLKDFSTTSTNEQLNIYSYSLNQNYPNPFNPSTTISFSLPKAEYVTLKIYNTLGEEIKTLVNSQLDAGEHKINFDASNVSSGIYFYKITAGEYSAVKKMQYIK